MSNFPDADAIGGIILFSFIAGMLFERIVRPWVSSFFEKD